VRVPAPSPSGGEGDFAVVFQGSAPEANLVKGRLESSGIPAHLRDENVGSMLPLTGMPTGFGSVKVVVQKQYEVKARRIFSE